MKTKAFLVLVVIAILYLVGVLNERWTISAVVICTLIFSTVFWINALIDQRRSKREKMSAKLQQDINNNFKNRQDRNMERQ